MMTRILCQRKGKIFFEVPLNCRRVTLNNEALALDIQYLLSVFRSNIEVYWVMYQNIGYRNASFSIAI